MRRAKNGVSVAKRAQLDFGISMTTAQIGAPPYMRDYDDQWEKVKGIKTGGAILVLLDNFVAWRSLGPSENSGAELGEALSALLGKPGKSMERFQEKIINGDSAY
jgi:hypothetical protein